MGRLPWAGSHYRRNPDPNGAPWGPDLYNPLEDEDHPFKDESEYRSVTKPLYRRNPYRRNPYGYAHDSSEAGQSGLYTSIFSRSRRNRRRRNPRGSVISHYRRNPEKIKSEGWDGAYVLVKEDDNYRVEKGTAVEDFRGDTDTLQGGRAPHKASSQGKIWVGAQSSSVSEYYPSVFGLKWLKIHARNPFGQDNGDTLTADLVSGEGLYKSIFSRRRRHKRKRRRNRRRHNPFGLNIFDTVNTWDSYWDRGRV